MKKAKIPMRSCVVTKEQLPKKELIRVVRDKAGNVSVDLTGKANGRGAYLKKDLKVFEQAFAKKVLNRHLEVEVSESVLEDLKKALK